MATELTREAVIAGAANFLDLTRLQILILEEEEISLPAGSGAAPGN